MAVNLVRLACEMHFRDIAQAHKKGFVWRPDVAVHTIALHQGEWAGQRIQPSLWQQFIHGSVFGWFREDGDRRFRVVWEEVARKNGQSGLGRPPVEPGADMYSAVTKKDQARIVFDERGGW